MPKGTEWYTTTPEKALLVVLSRDGRIFSSISISAVADQLKASMTGEESLLGASMEPEVERVEERKRKRRRTR